MNANSTIFEKMDYLRADGLENVNIEPQETVRVSPVEQVQTAIRVNETPKDAAEQLREEKIESWMQTIKEFIRGIDVKAL